MAPTNPPSLVPNYLLFLAIILVANLAHVSHGSIPPSTMKIIRKVNKNGPYVGVVIPNAFEMSPFLQSPAFVANPYLPYLDFGGRRFRLGSIEGKKVIVVMTGLSMLNAGLTTQLLITLFRLEGVVHFGIAGNADPDLQIGDVTVPRAWAHLGLWNWQRYGDGPDDELALEAAGDYTRKIGRLHFSEFNTENSSNITTTVSDGDDGNFLNSVWYQEEEIFPVDGVPEVRQRALWVPVDTTYLALSRSLQGMELEKCVNSTTCLPRSPIVAEVERGCSANTFIDNAAYREFLRGKFNVTSIDMETAAVGLVCLQHSLPFVALRSLSDLAGGGSAQSNEADIFGSLAAENVAKAAIKFISLLK